jgi:hypothetical protein
MSKGDKLQQIRCRLLSPFLSPARLRQPGLYDRKGLVSDRKLPKVWARRTRDIRIELIFGNVPVNTSAGCRARKSEIPLYVAGQRVNVLLASSGCAPHCTRRPAPGFCG